MYCYYLYNNNELTDIDFDKFNKESAESIVELLNKQQDLINVLLHQFGELGYNNKPCQNCISYKEDIQYCTMYDMDEVTAEDIVVRCEDREERK